MSIIMEQPFQEILSFDDLIKMEFTIPNYQRPYKWNRITVEVFLNDIYKFVFKEQKRYRLGTLILHKDGKNTNLNIVDGQQRITTLYLILKYLDSNSTFELKNESKSIHPITAENIKINYAFIHNWFTKFKMDNNIEEYKEIILKKCEFVSITVNEINSAFQLFDSQNTRGKALNPEDLLKAFHLQKMSDTDEKEKIIYVEKWEKLATTGELNLLFGERLYRVRNWAKGEADYYFNKNEINEFKGVDVENCRYNYFRPMAMNLGLIEQMKNNKVNQLLNITIDYPFMITQKIINGKNFFDYVFYFHQFYKEIIDEGNKDFREFYKKYCEYPYSYRTGDYYTRNFYENLLAFYANHFNKNELKPLYKSFYKLSYEPRLSKRLNLKPVLDNIKVFEQIDNSHNPNEFTEYIFKKYKSDREIAKGLGEVEKFIVEN